MADQAHEWTDEQIEALQRKFRRVYGQAEREMREKLDTLMADYERSNNEWLSRLASGTTTQREYDAWLRSQASQQGWARDMVDVLSQDAVRADQLAMDYVNDAIPYVFAENANRAAFEVEKGIGQDTHSFDLYDQDTVRRLIAEEPELLPSVPQPKFDNGRDLRWNRQKFSSAITQSILQGESIPHAARRLSLVMRMNESSAVRAARTAITGAENAGRVHSYERAKRIGIDLEQEWMATLDMRTRYSHRQLDGQHVPVGEKFEVEGMEIEFPGDPTAPGELVWNCRCTLVAWFPDIEQEDPERWSKLPNGMTYEDWKAGKKAEQKRQESAGVVNGKDILGTWRRRPDQYDFEIEDVMAAQGFDGKPRVVSAEEFDAAVRAANNGNGFIAQRTYAAPDKQTLEAYRQTLYDGKWYVDCSAGGAQYGQGMYCAADYTGTLSQGIRSEMEHYSSLNVGRLRNASRLSTEDVRRGITLDDMRMTTLGRSDDPSRIEGAELFVRMKQNGLNGAYDLPESDRPLYRAMRSDGRWDRLWEMHDEAFEVRWAEAQPSFYVETMTLDPSARIISWGDVISAQNEYLDTLIDQGMTPEQVREVMPSDLGSFAAARGYDAINAEGHGQSGSYTVILNRTKVIIKEPE